MSVTLEYEYQDAGGWRTRDTVTFDGQATDGLRRRLDAALANVSDGTDFIPQQVGLRGLVLDLAGPRGPEDLTDDDHIWHHVTGVVETADEPTDGRTFAEFVEQAEAVDGRWNDGVMAEDLYGGW